MGQWEVCEIAVAWRTHSVHDLHATIRRIHDLHAGRYTLTITTGRGGSTRILVKTTIAVA